MIKYLASLALFFFSGLAMAQQKLELPAENGTYQFELSSKISIAERDQLKSDFTELKKILIRKSALTEKLYGSQSLDFLDWFAKRISRISRYNPKPGKKGGQIIAVYADKDFEYHDEIFEKGWMVLTPHYFRMKDLVVRLMILIHEAKHADGVGHVQCFKANSPALSSSLTRVKDACDADEYGSYAAGALFELLAALHHKKSGELIEDILEQIVRVQKLESRKALAVQLQEWLPGLKSDRLENALGLYE